MMTGDRIAEALCAVRDIELKLGLKKCTILKIG